MDNKRIEDAFVHVMQGQKEKSSTTSSNRGVGQSITIDQLYALIFEQRQQIEGLSNRVDSLEKESLKNCNDSLNQKVKELTNEISDKNAEIAQLRQQLENAITEYRLENKYSDVLLFLQKLNKYIDDEKIDRDFAVNIREYIASVLNTYDYRIVDYSPEIAYAYEEENSSVEFPELVRRAIIDNKGNVVLKGKVYVNKQ